MANKKWAAEKLHALGVPADEAEYGMCEDVFARQEVLDARLKELEKKIKARKEAKKETKEE